MHYVQLHSALKREVNYADDGIRLECGLTVRNFDFHSKIRFRPESTGADEPKIPVGLDPAVNGIQTLVNRSDAEIRENFHFRYHLFCPKEGEKAGNVIIMFHGFNEKNWHKYLPWAAHLAATTGSAVLLFPIAFHMNRAPSLWSDIRAMHTISKTRRQCYPDIIHSTLSNVAISTRLHNRPERFVWSGLESYHDVIDLVEDIKAGNHPAIRADAGVDFFSYSVGSFLGQILMMTNKNGYFSRSRFALFCGGPVFNRLSPVSKFILDSEANVRLYSYLVEHLDSHMAKNPSLAEFFSGKYGEGVNLRSLLNYRVNLKYREDAFRSLSDRMYAIALADDAVVPPYEVINTLRGSKQDIGTRVDVLDFPYPYRHEDPFPANGAHGDEVDVHFRKTFGGIGEFLTLRT